MDPVRNPYMPGAGRKPAALVGRDEVIESWQVALQRAEHGRTDQPFVLYGLRGVGKTVLLTKFRHLAEQRGWIAVQVEAGTRQSMRQMIGEGLYGPLSDLARPTMGEKFKRALKTALSFKASYDSTGTWNFGLDLNSVPGGGADSGVLETDLKKIVRDLSHAARENRKGLAILIDEAQDLETDELTTMAVVAQAAAQDDWPFLVAFAGLPRLPETLATAKSYTERFHYSHVERLTPTDAAAALERPARDEGVKWEADALACIVDASGRYPYFIQQFGKEAWNEADGNQISRHAADLGIARGQNDLDNGFFRARWDRTTPAEKEYLRAMSPEGETGIASGEVAQRLNKTINQLGPVRAKLISKGLIYAPSHGLVAFTVPGMPAFIARQHDN